MIAIISPVDKMEIITHSNTSASEELPNNELYKEKFEITNLNTRNKTYLEPNRKSNG